MSVLELELETVQESSFNDNKFLLASAVDKTNREGPELACHVTVNRDTSCVLMETFHVI